MNNFTLFILGSLITLVSGFGVLIYITSLGYKRSNVDKKHLEKIDDDVDLGATETFIPKTLKKAAVQRMRVWIDPPQGWMFGFPKIWDNEHSPELMEWLVSQGYPQEEIDRYGKDFFVRSWEAISWEEED